MACSMTAGSLRIRMRDHAFEGPVLLRQAQARRSIRVRLEAGAKAGTPLPWIG
jgi:hypothetical protein